MKRIAKPAAAPKLAPKPQPKPAFKPLPEPRRPMTAAQRRAEKQRFGGCFQIAAQKRRIEKKRGKGGVPGWPSATNVVQKITLPVVSIVMGFASILAAFVYAGSRAVAGYLPEIERQAERERLAAYQRRNAPSSLAPSPKSFAAAYAAEGGGESSAGGARLKPSPDLPAPTRDPGPDVFYSKEAVEKRSERDFGDKDFVGEVSKFFKIAVTNPEAAIAGINGAVIGSYSEEFLNFLRHPLRSDLKNLDARIHSIAKENRVSREAATEIAMDEIVNLASRRQYENAQRAIRLAAIEAEENPSPPSHGGTAAHSAM